MVIGNFLAIFSTAAYLKAPADHPQLNGGYTAGGSGGSKAIDGGSSV